MTVQVEIWDRANTTKLCDLYVPRDESGGPWGPLSGSARGQVVGPGAGDVEIQLDHPSAYHLDYLNVVRFLEDSVTKGVWRVTELDIQQVQPDPGKRHRAARGVGLMDVWNNGIVLPWVAITSKPISANRVWNYASPTLPVTAPWTNTVYVQDRSRYPYPRPIAWPDSFADPIYYRPEAETDPVALSAYKRFFHLDAPAIVTFNYSADDRFKAWLNGVELETEDPVFPAHTWWYTWRAAVALPAGNHCFCMLVSNDDASGPGMLYADALQTDASGILYDDTHGPYWVSGADGNWYCVDLTTNTVGFTAGDIALGQRTESMARGAMLDTDLDFDGVTDSDGNPFEIIPELVCRVGAKGGELIQAMEPWAEFAVDKYSGGYMLQAFAKDPGRGGASGVDLVYPGHLKSLVHHGTV